MDADRARYGPLISALGAIALAVAVFLPWYGLSFTASGIAMIQQLGGEVASRLGNGALNGYMANANSHLSALAGHSVAALSAHQALKRLNVVFLLVAGAGILLSLVALARSEAAQSDSERQLLALLGALASVCVIFRMVDPPNPAASVISLSLREGSWIALVGSLAMVVGALLPSSLGAPREASMPREGVWSELSGWTPEA